MTVRPWSPRAWNRLMSATRWTGSAVEGLVEDEHPGHGHERGGDLGPLAHALAEAGQLAVGDVGEAHRGQAGVGQAAVVHPVQGRGVADELAGGQRHRDGLVLGNEGHDPADPPGPAGGPGPSPRPDPR